MFALCHETLKEYDVIKFKKGKAYRIEIVHDLIQIFGEKNKKNQPIVLQVEHYETDEWLKEHFIIYNKPQIQKQKQAV